MKMTERKTSAAPQALATKVTRFIKRADGTEVKIVATQFIGVGLHSSVGVDVFKRESCGSQWSLCSDRPHPRWREMSVAEYCQHGRSPKLQAVSHGEILKTASLIGQPVHIIERGSHEH